MLPKTVKIGAHTYEVKEVTQEDLGPDVIGDQDGVKNVLRVLQDATPSRKIEVLIHECLHAMLLGHGFRDEERIVVMLGEAFTAFLADNKGFIMETLRILSEPKKP